MEHILPFAEEHSLLPDHGLILCAVSGGPDSVALLHFLKQQGFRVSCAHFDHHLRPTSGRDAAFEPTPGQPELMASNGVMPKPS